MTRTAWRAQPLRTERLWISRSPRRGRLLPALAGACVAFALPAAHADNRAFQQFFSTVCTAPTGPLAVRCGESNGGNLSGDSQSSLNPNQSLSSNDTALASARTRGKQSREKTERLRDGDAGLPPTSGVALDYGPFSLLLHARAAEEESDRRQDADAERGSETESWAGEIGLDYRVTERTVIGAILGYEEAETEFDANLPGLNFVPLADAGEIDSEAYALTLFASHNLSEAWYIEASGGYTESELEIERRAVFQNEDRDTSVNSLTSGESDGSEYWASLSSGYAFQLGAWSLSPYAGISWARSSVDGYREEDLSGSGFAMRIAEVERESLIGLLGFSINAAISTGAGVVMPHLRLEYEHEFDRDAETLAASFLLDAADTAYTVTGDDPDEDFFNIGIGLVAVLPDGWMPFIDYEAQLGNDSYERFRITIGLRLAL